MPTNFPLEKVQLLKEKAEKINENIKLKILLGMEFTKIYVFLGLPQTLILRKEKTEKNTWKNVK